MHARADIDDPSAVVRLLEVHGDRVVVTVPGTTYRLELTSPSAPSAEPGARIRGMLEGRAQKIHHARAGGEFIEPAQGHPRLVQGRVRSVDRDGGRLLVQAVVPMWITPSANQSAADFAEGDIVNFTMERGVTFASRA